MDVAAQQMQLAEDRQRLRAQHREQLLKDDDHPDAAHEPGDDGVGNVADVVADPEQPESDLQQTGENMALSNSSQPMDPKLQAELERLSRAEAQRTEQQNFDWACGMVVGVIVLVGFALFILIAMAAGH